MHALESYQDRIVREALAVLRAQLGDGAQKTRNVLIEAPTGAGKSGMLSLIVAALAGDLGCRGLILEDSQQVYRQMAGLTADGKPDESEVAKWLGFRPGAIGDASHRGGRDILNDQEPRVVVGMVDTIRGWIETVDGASLMKDDYFVIGIDEAHHTFDHEKCEYRRVLEFLGARATARGVRLLVVGASATPWREDTRKGYDKLDRVFDNAARLAIPFVEVQRAGRVVMPETEFLDIVNERGESASMAFAGMLSDGSSDEGVDLRISAALAALRTDQWWASAVERVVDRTKGHGTIWFVDDNVNDAAAVVRHLERSAASGSGVRFAVINEKTSPAKVTDYVKRFNAGEIDHIVSCHMLIEGFNSPRAKIGVNAKRLTNRRVLHQMAGRLVRACPGYTGATLIELGATSWVHGRIEDRYRTEWIVDACGRGILRADDMLAAMEPIGNGWRGYAMPRATIYAKALPGGGFKLGIAETLPGGKRRTRMRDDELTEKQFLELMTPVFLEMDYHLGAFAAPPSANGRTRGFRSALDEHLSDHCPGGEQLEKMLRKEAPARRASVSGVIVQTPESALRDVRRDAEAVRDAVKEGKDFAPAAKRLLSSFLELGGALPKGRCRSARPEFAAVSLVVQQDKALSPRLLNKLLPAVARTLAHADIVAIAEAAEMGGNRKAAIRLLDETVSAVAAMALKAPAAGVSVAGLAPAL